MALVTALALQLLPAATASIQFYDGVGDPPPFYPAGGTGVDIFYSQWGAQSFRASASYTLTRIDLWAMNQGPPGEYSTLEIRPDNAGSPNMGVSPLASATTTASNPFGWTAFLLTPEVPLSQGTAYWVVLENSAASSGQGWSWWNTRNDSVIASGQGKLSSNLGATWGNAPGDFELRTFGYQETRLPLTMAVDRPSARAGEVLTYTLWFNNTGSEVANSVWLNDSMPPGLVYVSDNATAAGGSRTGNYNWTFANLAPGTHYFLLRLSLGAGPPNGASMTNRADLDYTDFRGSHQPRSTATATVIAIAAAGPPAGGDLWIFVDVGALAGLLLFFLLLPRGRVDEAFLVDYGGTLVAHFSRTIKPDKDRQLVAAMLTAVQAFIRDAFATAKEGELRHMDFGERKLFIGRGKQAYLAVVVRGRTPLGLRRNMTESLRSIEAAYGEALAHWSGSMAAVAGADEMLSKGLFGNGHGLLRRLFGGRSPR